MTFFCPGPWLLSSILCLVLVSCDHPQGQWFRTQGSGAAYYSERTYSRVTTGLEETGNGLQSPLCVIAQDTLLLLPWTACHVPRVPGQGSPLESWGPGLLGVWSHGHVPPEGKLVTAMNHNIGANNPNKLVVRLGSGGWSSLKFSVNLRGRMPVSVVCFSPWAGPILRAQRDLFFMCRRSNLFPQFWLCHTYSFSNYPLFVQYKIINSDKQSAKGHQAMCFISIGLLFLLLC